MLEFLATFVWILVCVAGYIAFGVYIAGQFDELANDRYIYLWPVVLVWLVKTVLEDVDWFLVISRLWWRLKEPFYVEE